MKKLLTLLLSLAMILTTGTAVFAEEGGPTSPYTIESVEEPDNSVDINVYAQYKNGDDVTKFGDSTYNVVVTWSIDNPISFTKKNVQVYKWDASQFKYVVQDDEVDPVVDYTGSDGNKTSTVDIQVKNLSDAKVYAEITYVQEKDSSDKAVSKIAGVEEADITSTFNSNSSKVLDDIFGGATITSTKGFEELIVKEWYWKHYAKNFWMVANDNYAASDLITKLTTCSANAPYNNTYKDTFVSLKNAGKLSTTSDLLKLLADDETLLDSDKTNFEAILGDDAPKIVYKVNGTKVMLTEDGEKFVASKDVNTNVKIGHFNVKVSVANNEEN